MRSKLIKVRAKDVAEATSQPLDRVRRHRREGKLEWTLIGVSCYIVKKLMEVASEGDQG